MSASSCSRHATSSFLELRLNAQHCSFFFAGNATERINFRVGIRHRSSRGLLPVADVFSEFCDKANTSYQQNTAYDATRIEWMRLHSEPAEMVD